MFLAPDLQLPWSSSVNDDQAFWRILRWLLVPFLLLSLAIPFIPVPEPEREELEKLPPQLARVVMEKKELPKPPPPPPKPVEEKKPEEKKPEPKEEKKPEPKPPEKKPPPEPAKLKQAVEQAKKSGVLQFSDDLASMRDALDVDDVKSNTALTRSKAEATAVERDFIDSGAKAKSGGIDTASLSRDTGGVALSGKETTAVESKLEEVSAAAEKTRETTSSREKSFRGDQTIRQKMDEAKGRIFSIYNRALRSNPTLQGEVMFKLVIEPDGSVSKAEITSSDLNDPDLESKLLAAIQFINFGAADVMQTTLNYSFDFLPY